MRETNISGQRFGRLVAIKRDTERDCTLHKTNYWLCQCDCGNVVSIRKYDLQHHTRSCGCEKGKLIRETKEKHGWSRKPLYYVWKSMKARCSNKNLPSYKNYGGRGITVCEEWADDFELFKEWAFSSGYKEGLSIDRIDNNGNYEPKNCKWSDAVEQQNNRRSVVNVTYNGVTQSIAKWAREIGVSEATIRNRLKRGLSIEVAMSSKDWRFRNASNVGQQTKTLLR